MEPPLKRPRLSTLARDLTPDTTLSRARWRNDLSLKSRFEAIFEKYAHDFTGIGDEIEVATGAVVVNNGHLEAMADEGDTGTARPTPPTPPKQLGAINGGSLLRTMTAAPEDHGLSFDDIHDEDVVMSIEAIAENAAGYSDDDDQDFESTEDATDIGYDAVPCVLHGGRVAPSNDDLEEDNNSGDEELFQMTDDVSGEQFDHANAAPMDFGDTDLAIGYLRHTEHDEQISVNGEKYSSDVVKQEDGEYWSGGDLLFRDRDNDRSSSPDSLFEVDNHSSDFLDQDQATKAREPAYPELPSTVREVSDDAILDKFGPNIGPQVIDVLQKRRAMMDAHIEPAWRLPDIGVVFPRLKLETTPDDLHVSPEPSSGRKESLWRSSQSFGSVEELQNTISRRVRDSSQLSNESEDPLQEDFHQATHVDDDADDADDADNENAEVSLDDVHDGICPFCRKQFSVTGSVYAHWDELIKRSAQDDVHDMTYIRYQRKQKRSRSQFPKVTVQDFYTMIKLREVDKLDWQKIYDRKCFGQRPATSIHSIYYQYRTLAKTDEELAAERRSWTVEEDARLLGFCEDRTITFQKLRKLMSTRTQAELGNRLASIWTQKHMSQGIEFESRRLEDDGRFTTAGTRLQIGLAESQIRHGNFESNRLRRSWSSDSMDSLFQVDIEAGRKGDHGESDDGLFGRT